MKKIIFTICLISTVSVNAQVEKGLFIDANFGTRFSGTHSDSSTLGIGYHADGGLRYMVGKNWGIKADMGYDAFSANPTDESKVADRSYNIRASIQGVLSISEVAKLGIDKFSLLMHGGFGFTTNINPNWKKTYTDQGGVFGDPFIEGNDDMVNFIIGLTPQYVINNKLAINLDFSTIILVKESGYVDREFDASINEGTGIYHNLTVGISYKIPTSVSKMK